MPSGIKCLLRSVFFCLQALFVVSCAGLGGEPAIVATFPPPAPEARFPVSAPDLELGARLYAQHCSECHGPSGAGDGELIGDGEGQIPNRPASFLEPATMLEQSPYDWYVTISEGRIENLMPPWGDALTEAQRWAVALYTYTLQYGPNARTEGEVLAATLTASVDPDLITRSQFDMTDDELLTVANSSGELSTVAARQVAAFLRSLGVNNPAQMGQLPASPESVDAEEIVSVETVGEGFIEGAVIMGTPDLPLPPNLVVSVLSLSPAGTEILGEVSADVNGEFMFGPVDTSAEVQYLATVEYEGRLFGSEVGSFDGERVITLQPVVYALTSDPASIVIAGIVLQVVPSESGVSLNHVLRVVNNTDRAYSSDERIDDRRFRSLAVAVPQEATPLGIDIFNARFGLSVDAQTIFDSSPVLPGRDHIVQVSYVISDHFPIPVQQTYNYRVDGPIRLLIPMGWGRVISNQLTRIGEQTLNDINYEVYGMDAAMSTGGEIRFTLDAFDSAVASAPAFVPVGTLALLGIVVAIVFAGVFALILRRRARSSANI